MRKLSFAFLVSFIFMSLGFAQNDTTFFKKHFTPIFYLQTQFNYVNSPDSVDVTTQSGGKFKAGTNNAFSVRRGRLGMLFNYKSIESKITFDVTNEGFFAKDAYFRATDPWIDVFDITAGYFKVPFGFEIAESSADRLFAERVSVIRHLFPTNRDLGMQLGLKIPGVDNKDKLKLSIAVFNGNNSGHETNNFKDLAINADYKRKFINDRMEIGAGVSFFLGNHGHVFSYDKANNQPQLRRNIFEVNRLNDTLAAFVSVDSLFIGEDPSKAVSVKRKYIGGNLNFAYKWSESKGWKTKIYGEYLQGTQPGVINKSAIDQFVVYQTNSYSFMGPELGVEWKNSESPQSNRPAGVNKSVIPYHTIIRDFRGGYFAFIQQIANTGLELGFRLDVYDPNINVNGDEIKDGVFTNADGNFQPYFTTVADIKYTTYGFVLNYAFNKHFRAMLQYDMVKNEITGLKGLNAGDIGGADDVDDYSAYDQDVKDDVLTFRLQVNF